MQHRTFFSAALNSEVSYHLYTPDAYDEETERRFPVLYWLHGGGGGLNGIQPLGRHFDTAIRTGRIPPMLVVFPNGLNLSLWVDSKDGSVPMETIVMQDLVPHIDASYRTLGSREGRMIEGFSMGGYGAARLAFKHHETFGAASIISGGPLQQEFTATPRTDQRGREMVLRTIFGGDHEYYRTLSPWVLAEKNASSLRGENHIRVVIGGDDEMLQVTREFEAHLTRLAIPHEFAVIGGVGHRALALLNGLGEDNWAFYRSVFDGK